MNDKSKNEKGLVLGFTIITVLIILMVSSFDDNPNLFPAHIDSRDILTGIYLQLWGILFLLSYFYSHKTFFLRALIWVCENFSAPKGRKMAFFYFALFFSLGTGGLAQGLGYFSNGEVRKVPTELPPGVDPIENWWYKDPMLYIVLFIIIMAILYKTRMKKK